MSMFGTLLGTVIDVATAPIAIVKDVIPGGGGYVDGNQSHTEKKVEQVSDDLSKLREQIEEL